jgi:tRNA (mo5U34)-methyltransferase
MPRPVRSWRSCDSIRDDVGRSDLRSESAGEAPRRASPREQIAGLDWWHTIEIEPGLVTPGGWDLRPTARRIPWPRSLRGLRCLDIGTMDGFWAFELERRGADAVVAIDLPASNSADPFPGDRGPGRSLGETFRVAAELLGSDVEYRHLNVYDLDPADVGLFDLVFMGYVLQMLSDPLRGLRAVRGICRGSLIVLDTVSAPLSLVPAPVARLDARRDGSEWFVFNPRGLRQALRLAGFTVEATSAILRDNAGPRSTEQQLAGRLLHAAGIRGRSVAVRARPAV